jgi:hypothetical protein
MTMKKKKRTTEDRERLRRVLEQGREARRYMQDVIDRYDARRKAESDRASGSS